ncbi:hypothetical protein BaRGS_00007968 [Batillaria attramentaria]|uniref:Uncharacterized protein n=1 Tax=Batillaria attramentaria TaxID=370345 RepID=A0ABD0LNX7_9CAEN
MPILLLVAGSKPEAPHNRVAVCSQPVVDFPLDAYLEHKKALKTLVGRREKKHDVFLSDFRESSIDGIMKHYGRQKEATATTDEGPQIDWSSCSKGPPLPTERIRYLPKPEGKKTRGHLPRFVDS